MRVDILPFKQAREYDALFADHPFGLIQRSSWWADIVCPLLGDTPYFLVASDTGGAVAGLPLYHFSGFLGGILTSVPHAGPLGGIFIHRSIPDERKTVIYDALLEKAFTLARELSCQALTIITDPFSGDAGFYLRKRPDYVLENFCQAVFLRDRFRADGAYTARQAVFNNDLRRNLRKAQESGVLVGWEGLEALDSWVAIHRERSHNLGIQPLPEEFLKRILTVLAPMGKAGLAIARAEREMVGGCLYVWHGEVVDVFMMSSLTRWLARGVNYALADFSLKYFHARGMKIYNWQSSIPRSGVFSFKERWGSEILPYDFVTWTFPGFERFLAAPLEEIRRGYAWHYVAPYPALEERMRSGTFRKKAN